MDTEAQATRWLVRLDATRSPELIAEHATWMAESARNRVAYMKASLAWKRMDALRRMRPLDPPGEVDPDLLRPRARRAPGFGPVLALFPWDQLAVDAKLPDHPRPSTFRGMTLAWNCRAREEVDAVLAFAVGKGAALLKAAHETDYGGYSGYFADPDGHPWEVVVAPGIEVGEDRRVHLAE